MNTNNNFQNMNCGQPQVGSPTGQEGVWVPVDANSLPFTVGGNVNEPIQGPDGSYYCISPASPNYGPIGANLNNAIPTPSSTVQLPAIVQPIALVPYASQNQPLVQYNPSYQPEIPLGNSGDPVYKAKPYAALSVSIILFAVASVVALALLSCLKSVSSITGLDAVLGLAQKFNLGEISSKYYTEVFDPLSSSADIMVKIAIWAIPIIFALLAIFAVILTIKYLVKLGGRKSPRCFSVLAFIGLILSAINLVIFMMSDVILGHTLTVELGMYIALGAYLLMFILPFFAKKGAVVVDLEASKRVYTYR
ncbi:MAG: hypothetical protein GX242_05365 [Clostridiales bacterium]|jgi:hypothetical protein|nr:hypothetical protein [Clostridiales bacterium]